MIVCKVFTDLNGVDANTWNSMVHKKDWLHSHQFLSTLQSANVEQAIMYFVMMYKEDVLIGTAVLSDFKINLDLFIQAKGLTHFIKKLRPNVFKTRILFAGIPLSSGQKSVFSLPDYETDVVLQLNREMEKIANERKIKTLVVKEFNDRELQRWQAFEQVGFIAAHSLPSVNLTIAFSDFEAYLAALKSTYRRQIKTSIAKMYNEEALATPTYSNRGSLEPHIALLTTADLEYEKFYNWYIAVLQRATTKLEALNGSFFEHLWAHHSAEIKMLGCVDDGKIKAAILFTTIDDEVNFLWSAKDFERDTTDTYFNLLNALVAYAIAHKFKKIVLGQTAYYPKMKIGGRLESRSFYIKSTSKMMQFLFKRYNRWLFPELKVKQLKVFKHEPCEQK